MRTNRHIGAKEPLTYLKERIDRADLGEDIVKDRLKSHVVPFESLRVGGYALNPSSDERRLQIQSDYTAFRAARASLLRAALVKLCEGRDWPNVG